MNDVAKSELDASDNQILEQRKELERFVYTMTEVKETLSTEFKSPPLANFVNAQIALVTNEIERAEQNIAKLANIKHKETTYDGNIRIETVYENGVVSNRDGAAKSYYNEENKCYREDFYIDNTCYDLREYFAEIGKYKQDYHFKTNLIEAHLKNGLLHNESGAALIRRDENGNKTVEVFEKNGSFANCNGGENPNVIEYRNGKMVSQTYNCLSMNDTYKPTEVSFTEDGGRVETKNEVDWCSRNRGFYVRRGGIEEKLKHGTKYTFENGYDRKEYFKNGNLKKKSLLGGLATPRDKDGNIMPSEVTYYSNGNVKTEKYQYATTSWRGLHRYTVAAYCDSSEIGKPSYVEYYKDGGVKLEKTYSQSWGSLPKLDDINGKPAVVKYYEDGIVKEETSYDEGVKRYTDKYTKTGEPIPLSTPISKSESTSSLSM